MANEHNPIAQLVMKIQSAWNEEIVPFAHIQLVRWLIDPEQARLYEGFLRLESTQNGSIPDVPIVLLTHFEDSSSHSRALCADWIEQFENDEELQSQIADGRLAFNWDVKKYRQQVEAPNTDHDQLLIAMLGDFQQAMPDPSRHLVLSPFPYTISNKEDYFVWINQLLQKGMPSLTRIMFFDHIPDNDSEELMLLNEAHAYTLQPDLDLRGAVKELASSGNPNDPEVQFRECLMGMSECMSKNDLEGLHFWGGEGLLVTQKTGETASFAAAHVIYGGMLLAFSAFEEMEALLRKGYRLAMEAIAKGDEHCKSIAIQAKGYLAGGKRVQENHEEASKLYLEQANLADEYSFTPLALLAYWSAYQGSPKKNVLTYRPQVERAYNYGMKLDEETLRSSCIGFIAADLYDLAEAEADEATCSEIDAFMTNLDSPEWKTSIAEQRDLMKKKKRRFSLPSF